MFGLVIFMVISAIAATYEQEQVREQQKNALQMRLEQQKLAEKQQQVKSMRNLDTVFAQQQAQQAARGGSQSSSSFIAVQEDTLHQFQEDKDSAYINSMYSNAAIGAQINGLDRTQPLIYANGALNIAGSFANMYHPSYAGMTASASQNTMQSTSNLPEV